MFVVNTYKTLPNVFVIGVKILSPVFQFRINIIEKMKMERTDSNADQTKVQRLDFLSHLTKYTFYCSKRMANSVNPAQ